MKIIYGGYVYIESISPTKPNSVKSISRIINGGTNIASKQYYKEFNTSKGNNVKVYFNLDEFGSLKINFAVNNSYNVTLNESDRDILKNVLYIIFKYVSSKKPKAIKIIYNNDDGRGEDRANVFSRLLVKELPEYIADNSMLRYGMLFLNRKDNHGE